MTERSNALDLEKDVFTLRSPHAIAESLRRSAERSRRRKAGPFQSAMSMLNFYISGASLRLTLSLPGSFASLTTIARMDS